MGEKGNLRVFSTIIAALLSLSILLQSETNLSGFKLNVELNNFSKTKESSLKLRGNNKKPLRANSQGQPETAE